MFVLEYFMVKIPSNFWQTLCRFGLLECIWYVIYYRFIHFSGQVPRSDYHLESVHILIRHGDRNNMHNLPNYNTPAISCRISVDLKEQVAGLEDYHRHMLRLVEDGGRTSKQTFHAYNLFPNTDSCQSAQLTPVGAAQHLRNGQFLRKMYLDEWKLIDESEKWEQLMVRSTTKSRTFQSAVALMNGLVGDLDLTRMQLEEALNNSMCTERSGVPCGCSSIDEYIDVFSCIYHQLSPHVMAQSELQKSYAQIGDVLGTAVNSLPRPSHILDVSMIHYCHHLPLPSRLHKCMQPSSMGSVYDIINQNGRDQHLNSDLLKIVRLKLQPLMFEIAHRMSDRVNGKSPLKFVLYSSHDSAIEPFADAMGFSQGTWSRYAARIVLELYKNNKDNSAHIRVLHDGQVVTEDVIFCRDKLSDKKYGLCPLEHFIQFVDQGNMKSLNEDSYEKACQKVIPYK